MENFLNRNFRFIAPSGATYTIREQNGEDDDILSNPVTSTNLMNLSYFISSLIVEQNFYPNKKTISPEDALNLPSNDRYAILLNSRIHSIGNLLEFTHNWGGSLGEVCYELDLNEFLFNKSIEDITEEELQSKPEAIPLYPQNKFKDLEFSIGNKVFLFDILTGAGEQYQLELPLEKRTANQKLISRNLRLISDTGNPEKISNFRMFSRSEMNEIRKYIAECDPLFTGMTKIYHPSDKSITTEVNILGLPNFFWQEGIDYL